MRSSNQGLESLPALGVQEHAANELIFNTVGSYTVQWTLGRVLPGQEWAQKELRRTHDGLVLAEEVASIEFEIQVFEPGMQKANLACITEAPDHVEPSVPFELTIALSFQTAEGQAASRVHLKDGDAATFKLESASLSTRYKSSPYTIYHDLTQVCMILKHHLLVSGNFKKDSLCSPKVTRVKLSKSHAVTKQITDMFWACGIALALLHLS